MQIFPLIDPYALHADGVRITAEDIPEPPSDFAVVRSEAAMLAWIAQFDALSYVAKTNLGNANNTAYPLYEYQFGSLTGIPIAIDAVMHGSEQRTLAAAYWLAYCIVNANTPLFKWMRKYCNIRIIPIVNPYGYINVTRKNSHATNGIDLNRNFDWRWGTSSTAGDPTYAGASAESEEETQYIVARLDGSVISKPWLYINIHEKGDGTDKELCIYSPNYQLPQNRQTARDIASNVNAIVASYDVAATCVDTTVSDGYSIATGMAINWAASQGIISYTIESKYSSWDVDPEVANKIYVQSYVALMSAMIKAAVLSPGNTAYKPYTQILGIFNKNFNIGSAANVGGDIIGSQTVPVAKIIGSGGNISFVDSGPDTITDSGSGFLTAGWDETASVGDKITVVGTVNNNGTYTIAGVSAGTITLIGGDSLTAENPATCIVRSYDSHTWSDTVQQDGALYQEDAGIIHLDRRSTVIIKIAGTLGAVGASQLASLALWLDDESYTEYYAGTSQKSRTDKSYHTSGIYSVAPAMQRIYHNVPAGTYYLRAQISTSDTDITHYLISRYLTALVHIEPSVDLLPAYHFE